ncbi:hypothetical protein L3X38_004456 [Prunus dulcis]|uniref:Uncharacterized protein n=1 Tax=Prunus dulcis TaxID=3755 RepID=A0AAD4ZNX5_PRUDU|nr:hypothetical protein L3X38_004456 [Prunus dulcis]
MLTVGARIADQVDQMSPESSEDYSSNRLGVSEACEDCSSDRLGISEPVGMAAGVDLVSLRLARMELTVLKELTNQEWGYT